jgi:hypothetical protein
MSDESRLRALEEAVRARLPPRVVTIRLRVVTSREEWLKREAERAARLPRPPIKGRVRVIVLTTAEQYHQAKGSNNE